MRCAPFQRRYSAWIDSRGGVPLAADLHEHTAVCPRCAAFVRSIDLLEAACARARAAAVGDEQEHRTAVALADLVVEESRKLGILARPRGFGLALAGLPGAGLLALLLVRWFRPEWGVLLETGLIAAGLSALGIESILHAPRTDLSEPLPQKAQAGPA